jgi:hypothetical protein
VQRQRRLLTVPPVTDEHQQPVAGGSDRTEHIGFQGGLRADAAVAPVQPQRLVACVVCYLLLPALLQSAVPAACQQLVRTGALAVPFALWLTARLYFDDVFQPGLAHVVVLLGLLAVRALVLPWPLAAAGVATAVASPTTSTTGPPVPPPGPRTRSIAQVREHRLHGFGQHRRGGVVSR